jgi:hypothetical protein
LYIAVVRACLAEIREQQEQLRQRSDLTLDQRLDEIGRLTRTHIRLHQEWCEMLDGRSYNRKDSCAQTGDGVGMKRAQGRTARSANADPASA